MADKQVVITRENFFSQLELKKYQQRFTGSNNIDHFYKSLLDFLINDESILEMPEDKIQLSELAIRIPGTPVHVKLSGLLRDKVTDFIAIYLVLSGIEQGNWLKITASAVVELMGRCKILRKKFGERCIVYSLGEVSHRTIKEICLNLYGKDCRYKNAGCQFNTKKNNLCNFELDAIKETVEYLECKKILKKENSAEPIIWSVVL